MIKPASPRTAAQRVVAISVLFAATVLPGSLEADERGYRHDPYRYAYPIDPYWDLRAYDDLGLRREVRELNDKLRRQQFQLKEQGREQQEQTRLLRQQDSAQQRATARQACFDRMDGALNLCDRLFEDKPDGHSGCIDLAKEMHPGCAWELARPGRGPAD